MKTTQKTKKCLRCGRSYQVKSLLDSGIIVRGITSAINKVKQFQNQFGTPKFHAEQDFMIDSPLRLKEKSNPETLHIVKNDHKDSNYFNFLTLLSDLSQKYRIIPLYIIELMASDYDIPKKCLSALVKQFIDTKKLIKNGNNQYRIQL